MIELSDEQFDKIAKKEDLLVIKKKLILINKRISRSLDYINTLNRLSPYYKKHL